MKIFFDTEFTGLHQATTLIEIGLVAEDGRSFYAEFTDYAREQVNEWIEANVLAQRTGPQTSADVYASGDTPHVTAALRSWLTTFDAVEMWGDCLAYDWVLFCNLFGDAFSIPSNIYYIPFDLCTLLKARGIDPDVNRESYAGIDGAQHNALDDALFIKACYEKAMAL